MAQEQDDAIGMSNDNEPKFNSNEWIGQGKKYPETNVPDYISEAKGATLRIPEATLRLLPTADLPVIEFLAKEFPAQSTELASPTPEAWFSKDLPSTDVSHLFKRPIPPSHLLFRLEKHYGQAWFDGCQSIVDARFNHGTERFPVWILRFWRTLAGLRDRQDTWKRSSDWLNMQIKKAKGDSELVTLLEKASSILTKLPWDEKMDFERGAATTLLLAGFLGTVWLSDEHINAMVYVLAEDLQMKSPESKLLVAPLYLSFYVLKNGRDLKANANQWPSTYLRRYQQTIKEKEIEKLYFPIHINDCHWIAAEVDFKRCTVAYGDSYDKSGRIPHKFNAYLLLWLKYAFGKKFVCAGNTLECGTQVDGYSCGIVTANTLEHALFGVPLWNQKQSVKGRVEWFVRGVARQDQRLGRASSSKKQVSSAPAPEPSIQEVRKTIGISIADLLNPEDDEPLYAGALDESESSDWELPEDDDSASDGELPMKEVVEEASTMLEEESSVKDSDRAPVQAPLQVRGKQDLDLGRPRNAKQTTLPFLLKAGIKRKQNEKKVEDEEESEEEQRGKKRSKGNGSSHSARKSKELRAKQKDGTHVPKTGSVLRWQGKLREIDPDVEFDESKTWHARCSKCREWKQAKEAGDATHVGKHLRTCTGTTQSLLAVWGKGKEEIKLTKTSTKSATPTTLVLHPRTSLCPGLTKHDDARIPAHLKRSEVHGGGSRSVTAISRERFEKRFGELTVEQKAEVYIAQKAGEAWINQPSLQRVVSRSCETYVTAPRALVQRLLPCKFCIEVLKSKSFRNMLKKEAASTKNLIYVNKRFQHPIYGPLFSEHPGLRAMLENAQPNPFLDLAYAFTDGKLRKRQLFIGMAQSMVISLDKEERGVGLQNFKYPLGYEEQCQLIRDMNPQAYEYFSSQIPMPEQRTLREKRSREPKFPMGICDEVFTRVKKELDDIGWTGHVALSCDDTKLLSAYRLYWDSEKESYFLVGGVDGPLKVANAEQVKAVIEEAKSQKATKVRLWCATVPSPKVTPIIVAALPIGEKNSAQELFPWLKRIIDGLIDQGIRIVSYASDGTEVERSVQRMLLELGEPRQYTIKSPVPGRPDTVVKYTMYRTQALCIIQDSKHALKTLRNNLFSGARLLTLGNHIAAYRHIRKVADESGSPIYRRDVENLDRQDDNAATRLFSSGFLRYLVDNHKDDSLGSIVFLFVFGELVDAYQSRTMKHADRVHLALRARDS